MTEGTFKTIVLIAIWLPIVFGAGAFLEEDPSEAAMMLLLGMGISVIVLRVRFSERTKQCTNCGNNGDTCECTACIDCCGNCCPCCGCDCHFYEEVDDD